MARSRYLTEDEKKNIIKLLKEKKNAAEVARIVKRSHYIVFKIAKKNEIKLRYNQKVSEDEKKNIIKLLKEKKNAREVTRIVSRAHSTVGRIAKESGIDLGKSGPKPKK